MAHGTQPLQSADHGDQEVSHDVAVDAFVAAGLGLEYPTVRLARTTDEWVMVGSHLRDEVTARLDTRAAGVAQVGSSSVVGVLAKPIVDLAVGLSAEHDLAAVTGPLESADWIYWGDAGDKGGHVFVLEARPSHRVAHLHVVEYGGMQWRNYLRFKDLLQRSAEARHRYESVKLRLAQEHPGDPKAYGDGKSSVVASLLGNGA